MPTTPSVTPWGSGPLAVVVVDGEGSVSQATNLEFVNTTSLLEASGVFTSSWILSLAYSTVVLTVFSDQAGTLEFQWSSDGINIDRFETTGYTPGATGRAFSLAVRGKYLRIQYTNGGAPQTVFRLCATLHQSGSGIITKPLSAGISDDNFSQLVTAVLVGRKPDGTYEKTLLDANGNLKVSIGGGSGGGGGGGSGDVNVLNFPATQAVSAAFLPLPTGAATETTLADLNTKTPALGQATMAASQPVVIANDQSEVPVSGTFWQATQPVSGPLTDAQLRATPVPISGNLTTAPQASTLCVTATAAGAAACTLTLPGVANQFHYLTSLRITKYGFAAVTGTNTPVLVTTTNLPGNPVWTFARAHVIGSTDHQMLELAGNPLRSAVAGVNTTIVCPATTGFLWRVTAFYYAAG